MNILELKKIRKFLKISRKEMANELNISLETLNDWEYRTKEIPENMINGIKYVFDTYFNRSKSTISITQNNKSGNNTSNINSNINSKINTSNNQEYEQLINKLEEQVTFLTNQIREKDIQISNLINLLGKK